MTTPHPRSTHALAAAAVAAVLLTAAGPAAATPAPHRAEPTSQDVKWVSDSSAGDLFEVAGGRLAMQRSHDPAVRRFGHRMVVDHRRLYQATRAVARGLGIKVETEPSRGQQAVLRSWRHVSGHAFVCSYVPYEWEDHQLDIADTKDEIDQGSQPEVIADAQAALPVLQQHLDLVSRLLHDRHC